MLALLRLRFHVAVVAFGRCAPFIAWWPVRIAPAENDNAAP
jgi:hypothetical protein